MGCGSDSSDSAQKTARIMPLGDSITESSAGLPTYRYFLWKWAEGRGWSIDLVGSKRGTVNGPPAHADFDMDHEGHSGRRADEVLTQITAWASAANPDIV